MDKMEELWRSDFGSNYSKIKGRDTKDHYKINWNTSRLKMNRKFMGGLDKDLRILEVGCGIGLQLQSLRELGFTNLMGLDINKYTAKRARDTLGIDTIIGSVCTMPLSDGAFDLILTSALLNHVPPRKLTEAMSEIYRCTNRYIWGFEMYAPSIQTQKWRNLKIWRGNYSDLFREMYPHLKTLKEELIERRNWTKDVMYLLSK